MLKLRVCEDISDTQRQGNYMDGDRERVDLWRRASLREFVNKHISHDHADHGRQVDYERVDLWRRASLREFVNRHISHDHADHGRQVDYEQIDAWQRPRP